MCVGGQILSSLVDKMELSIEIFLCFYQEWWGTGIVSV